MITIELKDIPQKIWQESVYFSELAKNENWLSEDVKAEIDQFKKSWFVILNKSEEEINLIGKKILWYVTAEIAKINYWLYSLIKTKKLSKENLSVALNVLNGLSQYDNYLTETLKSNLSLNIKRIENISQDYEQNVKDSVYDSYLRNQCAFWFSFSAVKEFSAIDFRDLSAEVKGHLSHFVIIRWIFELFTNISQKISWYACQQVVSITKDLLCFNDKTSNLSIDIIKANKNKFAEEFTLLKPYLSETQYGFCYNELVSINKRLQELNTNNSNERKVLLLLKEEVVTVVELSQNIDKLCESISYCAGLLAISMEGKSYKELCAEIKEKGKLLKQINYDNFCFNMFTKHCSFLVTIDKDYLINYLLNSKILKNDICKIFIEYDLAAINSYLNKEKKFITKINSKNEYYTKGFTARSDIDKLEKTMVGKILLKYPKLNEGVIVFDNSSSKYAFLENLQDTQNKYIPNEKANLKSEVQSNIGVEVDETSNLIGFTAEVDACAPREINLHNNLQFLSAGIEELKGENNKLAANLKQTREIMEDKIQDLKIRLSKIVVSMQSEIALGDIQRDDVSELEEVLQNLYSTQISRNSRPNIANQIIKSIK